MIARIFRLLLLLALGAEARGETLKIVSLSTVITEIAEKVGGDQVAVIPLMRPGIDPHDFEPKPADLAQIASAQLVLASGKKMEGYLGKLAQSSATRAQVIDVGEKIPDLLNQASQPAARQDPHWWHSVPNVILAADIVRDALIAANPEHESEFRKNATSYAAELAALQKWIRLKVAELPRDQRKLVTSHDAFAYFAREYGFTIFPIQGLSTDEEPTPREISALIDEIKQRGVRAIFVESGQNPKMTSEISRASGAKVCGSLVADGLGTGPTATYAGLMRSNVTTIVEALK